jgi:hypothetical protein
MYSAACDHGANAAMFTSLALGEYDHEDPEYPTSGAIIVSTMDDASGTLTPTVKQHFPECESMHGIAVSDDCQTIGALCRIPTGTQGFDKDVLATHPGADWMTNPYTCGNSEKMNDEMWLYEWTNGDVTSTPRKYIVHKSIGSWEYGNDYLRLGNDGTTWGIALKTTVGGENGPDTCHEADAFLVMDRPSETMTTRGWRWACGTGHTLHNRLAYNAATGEYAMLCGTDYNEDKIGRIGAHLFRMEDGDAQEFHYSNLDGIHTKGGVGSILPRDDGGYIGVLVATDEDVVPTPQGEPVPVEPPTGIGLVQWSAGGDMEGAINWVLQDPDVYLGHATLAQLGPDRYLLGWGVMMRLPEDPCEGNSLRVPSMHWVVEIDGSGSQLTEPLEVPGAGWGDQDEMISLGRGRAGWAYIADPEITDNCEYPSCNQPALQLSVYTSPLG